jgi:HEAT repeat protein
VLGNGNQSVREASGRALLSIDGALGFDSMRALLKDSDSNRRVGAAEALARTADERAVQPLIQALRDENGKVRAAAAEALGEINDSRAIEPLIQALADDDSDVRSRAIDALARIGRPASDALILALENEDTLIKQGAAETLGEIKETRAIEPLISAFQSKEMRQVSVNALLKINKSSAVEPFILILKDERATDDMRADASWALGEMGDPRANEALLQTLASGKDNNVKMSAARALKRIKLS